MDESPSWETLNTQQHQFQRYGMDLAQAIILPAGHSSSLHGPDIRSWPDALLASPTKTSGTDMDNMLCLSISHSSEPPPLCKWYNCTYCLEGPHGNLRLSRHQQYSYRRQIVLIYTKPGILAKARKLSVHQPQFPCWKSFRVVGHFLYWVGERMAHSWTCHMRVWGRNHGSLAAHALR